jgi:hypothetical protein
MMTMNKCIFILVTCSSLAGCLGAEETKTTATASDTNSDFSTVMMSSVSSDKDCNSGKQGAIVYDLTKNQFFFCSGNAWTSVDLKGPKGDKGDKGDSGAAGAPGAVGASGPAGTNGLNGRDGRDGLDGGGVRMALKDGNDIKGILIQYDWSEGSQQKALMMLPNGDMIYIDVNTGLYAGKPWQVYYSDSGCTGDAYTGRSDALGPHIPGRIYVGVNDYGTPLAFYRADTWVKATMAFKSSRVYDTVGQMHYCKDTPTSASVLVRVTEISALPSLVNLAPIRFSP